AVFTKLILSGSTNGIPILVAATATAGTTIHDSSTVLDEVWLWAWNVSTTTRLLTLELGGVTDPGQILEVNIPAIGPPPTLVVPGWLMTGSVDIDAFAVSAANTIVISGYVNRIT
ncbi:MAG: hypothetical protein V3S38_00560, partial [Acidimicrobiia bacterium]